ncbi:hypothetical protein ABVT39_000233, partial [Epinephelus coioides]
MRSLSADKCISDKRAAERLGTTALLEVLAELSHGERFLSRDTFHTELAAEAPPDTTTQQQQQHPSHESTIPTRARSVSTPAKTFLWKFCERGVREEISTVPNCTRGYCEEGTATHSVPTAACKFGLKRAAGSLCASASDGLAQAPC